MSWKLQAFCLALTLLTTTALAKDPDKGFNADLIKDDYFLVSFEKSGVTRGGVLDSPKKARKKLELNIGRFCKQEGYSYFRILGIAEVGRDEDLKWAVENSGGVGMRTEKKGNLWTGVAQRNRAQQVVLLSSEAGERLERCVE